MSNTLWAYCLENLELVLSEEKIDLWIRPLDAVAEDNGLTLYAPNKYIIDEVKKNYLATLEHIVRKFEPDFNIVLKESRRDLFSANTTENISGKENINYAGKLNREFTFANFVTGSSNQIAAGSAMGVAKQPDGRFNPLMIYGSTGLGKSHLMHAIGNYIKANDHKKKVVYQTAEKFMNEMVTAIGNNSIDQFKKFYRGVDVLLIDDVQFIAGKGKTQEEFFHLFNTLVDANGQVVLTCDKYPKDVENLEERLKSRFGAGLPVAVEPPDLETREAILKKKAALLDFALDEKTTRFIAEKVRSYAMSQFNNQPTSIEMAKVALRDMLSSQLRQISVENIQKTVANYYRIKTTDLKVKSRKAGLVRARQVAMAITKQLTNLSLPDIGEAFERDHTTVMHAIKKVDELKQADPRVREDMTNIIMTLTS
ncbi:MAG: chromosomal replication initiator protein DnaA [Gammaproteobacteria bacterium]|nr:MAG: chromosomal replication initiator protein DnaA [Gammaproteobacteria bacterium]